MLRNKKLPRRLLWGVLLSCLTILWVPPAAAEDLVKTYNGKLIVSADPFPKKLDDELEKFLKTASKKDGLYALQSSEKGTWNFHMMAFFSKDPGGDSINLVFYDNEDKESQRRFEPLQSTEFSSTRKTRVFSLPSLSLSPEAGFVAGKTYLVQITQLKDGKEIILAQARLKLSAEQ